MEYQQKVNPSFFSSPFKNTFLKLPRSFLFLYPSVFLFFVRFNPVPVIRHFRSCEQYTWQVVSPLSQIIALHSPMYIIAQFHTKFGCSNLQSTQSQLSIQKSTWQWYIKTQLSGKYNVLEFQQIYRNHSIVSIYFPQELLIFLHCSYYEGKEQCT